MSMLRVLGVATLLCAGACAVDANDQVPQQTCAAMSSAMSRVRSKCGATLDFQEINAYDGDFPNVQAREGAVVLINGDCTGTLINGGAAGNLVLTAGHCVAVGDVVTLAFNQELCADGPQLVTEGLVVESSTVPDYALINVEATANTSAIEPTRLGRHTTTRLAIIQHPRGRPKVIAEGNLLDEVGGALRYVDLDTLVGGSGAGVLTTEGRLIGVHTNGDCNEDGGANAGWTAAEIVRVSPLLDDAVLDL